MEQIVRSINPRAKRLSLRVDQKAGVIKLTIPKWTMQRSIDRFLAANQDWIIEKSALLLKPATITNGATIPLMGIDHIIHIESHTKRTTEISSLRRRPQSTKTTENDLSWTPAYAGVTENVILIKTSRDDPTTNLKRWMIDQARTRITPLAHAKASQIKKEISKIDLRDTGSRWGSCSTDKRLMFSWRLIMAPPFVLDYVVAHEVAHLKHMDHSSKFWDVCYDLTDGDADAARTWLKQNGNSLMRWF